MESGVKFAKNIYRFFGRLENITLHLPVSEANPECSCLIVNNSEGSIIKTFEKKNS